MKTFLDGIEALSVDVELDVFLVLQDDVRATSLWPRTVGERWCYRDEHQQSERDQ